MLKSYPHDTSPYMDLSQVKNKQEESQVLLSVVNTAEDNDSKQLNTEPMYFSSYSTRLGKLVTVQFAHLHHVMQSSPGYGSSLVKPSLEYTTK